MAIQLDGTTGISTTGNIIADGTLTVGSFSPATLSSSGNVTGGNLNTAGALSVGGNSIISGDLTVVGNASLSGNIIGDKITNGTTSVEIPVANGNVSFTINGNSNVIIVSETGEYVTGVVSATGNITGGNLNAAGLSLSSNVVSAINSTSAITTSSNISANNFSATNFINSLGNISGANLTTSGIISATGNATAGNILTSGVVSSSGNITGANIATIGLISAAANITGGNILTGGTLTSSGNITVPGVTNSAGNSRVLFNNDGTFSANIILFQDSANGNITVRIGESTTEGAGIFGLYSTGTIGSIGNLTSQANILQFGNASTWVLAKNVGSEGVISAAGNITGNYFLGNGSQLTGIDATSIQNGTSNVRVVSSGGNVAIGVGGTSNVAVYATTGEYVTGLISATGNITGGNILTGGLVSATGDITGGNLTTGYITFNYDISGSGNITGGNLDLTYSGGCARGNLSGGNISMVGNITGGNILTAGVVSTGGNILSGYSMSAAGTITSADTITGANLVTGGLISATGNITGGNAIIGNAGGYGDVTTTQFAGVFARANGLNATSLMQVKGNDGIAGMGMRALSGGTSLIYANNTVQFRIGSTIQDLDVPSGGSNIASIALTGLTVTGIVSASGNVTGGNVLTGGLISATGNITGGNVNTNTVVGTGLTLVSTGDLTLSTTGNINVNNEYINNVPQPVQDGDAVNKLYVDGLVTTGFAFHQPVLAATVTTLATATGGTITYTQPNGVANGVGATLTTTGSFNLIDTANIQTIGARVLVKDQANAVQNGIYTWANATAIVRSTDADEYGADSTTAFGLNDYFFVQSGNVNSGAAYVVSAPSSTITFGTSNITFAEFSSAQTFTANTSAGLSLNGTVFNALVDNVTTAFSLGNIVVKTGAVLTTPNIGAATGTSLSVTGNITGGNLSGTSIVGTLTTAAQTNITSVGTLTSLAVTGNISGGNLSGTSIVGTLTTAAQTNITSVGTLGSLTVTGNATGGNLLTGGLISATGNITGGNLSGTSIVGTLTTAAQTNITSVGTLGSLAVTGNTTSGNFVGTLNGSGANVTSISATNISSGTLAQARLANASLTVNGTLIALGGSGTITATATGTLTIGSGLGGTSYNGSTGVTITNAGVLSLANGGGITASASTGAITLGSTATSANTAGAIVARGASGEFSAGVITATATSARYADLAESYAADAKYAPGTVLTFGGDQEVTLANESNDVRIAGVVSTNPAHVMNAGLDAKHVAVLALTGRVPTSVVGTVRKGDMMVSAGNGAAQACATPTMGTVIGKALENFDGESGTIEIVVGRL